MGFEPVNLYSLSFHHSVFASFMAIQLNFSNSDRIGCYLEAFVQLYKFERLLKRQFDVRR